MSRPHALRVRIDGREWTAIARSPSEVAVDDAVLRVTPAGPACWRVETPAGSRLVYLSGSAERAWAFVSGQIVQPDVERGAGGRPRRRDAHGTLTAPMPATVRAVLVEHGQSVEKGATLVVLEAMKMELPLRAPEAGIVQAVRCRVGELVQPGVPLVEVA